MQRAPFLNKMGINTYRPCRRQQALQELPEQDEQIDALLRRRLRSDTPDRDELRRASDYLYRRGFGRDEIRAAIARYQDNFEEY